MQINRFEPKVCEKGIKSTIENKGIVVIKDHATDKIVGMVNLTADPNKNTELAECVIDAIESWINNESEH